jgi:hypothetical protein
MIAVVVDPSATLKWYVGLAALTIALIVGMVWVYRVLSELRGEGDDTSDTPEGLLDPLSQAFESGQMSEEEYNRIRASVGKVLPDSDLRETPTLRRGGQSAPEDDAGGRLVSDAPGDEERPPVSSD